MLGSSGGELRGEMKMFATQMKNEDIDFEEEEELRDILDDVIDETIIRERMRDFDWDDESNFVTWEEVMAKAGLTQADVDAVGDVEIE